MLRKIIPIEDAIAIVRDGDVLATTGYGGNGVSHSSSPADRATPKKRA